MKATRNRHTAAFKATVAFTLRLPTPTSLAGFTFACLED